MIIQLMISYFEGTSSPTFCFYSTITNLKYVCTCGTPASNELHVYELEYNCY